MSDITPLGDIHEDHRSEQANVALAQDESKYAPPPSPIITRHRRRGSSVSRVDIGHFDPTGVDELRRNMSRLSATSQPASKAGQKTSFQSDVTLASNSPFDFEKTLNDVMKKYVLSSSWTAFIKQEFTDDKKPITKCVNLG